MVDQPSRNVNAFARGGRELDHFAAARNAHEIVQRNRTLADSDCHRTPTASGVI